MKLQFIGAVHEVTGSCTLLTACGKNILIDCGMEQGENIYENPGLPIAPNAIDAIFLTHAHVDHSGKIPFLAANGFEASIYSTQATYRLCRIMLMDSAHIQMFEAQWQNRKNKRSGREPVEPLYTTDDAEAALKLFAPCEYEKSYSVFDGIEIRFIDAGHLLGSSSIEIKVTENGITKTLLFSGDIGNVNRPLIRDPKMPPKADVVVIESTYGDRLHPSRPDYINQLTNIIQTTFDNGGNVIIPSFAVGRTQELLYLIRIIKEKHLIKNHDNFPVWVDSPLAVEATEIYNDTNLIDYFDEETLELLDKGVNPIKFRNLNLAVTSDESREINFNDEPKIILSASGMCEAGRIRHHLKHNLWRKECTILFVGYQAVGTLGRKIIDGATDVKLFGEEVHINARIEKIDGISGHADRNMLLHWLASMPEPPRVVFVNHGNDRVCDDFAKAIEQELQYTATAPFPGDGFEIGDTVVQTEIGTRRLVDKKSHKTQVANSVFERLKMAGDRLAQVIEQNRGGTNKDLAKFADQITALCEKWQR